MTVPLSTIGHDVDRIGQLAAQRVSTEAGFPQQWATTQNNLGIVYSDLLTGDLCENLQQAIGYYTAALRV